MRKTTTSSKTPNSPRPMNPMAIERAARSDRDAQPLTESDFKRMKRTPQAKIIRRALELTQEEFAARYHIPLGTLRDWEQGRTKPDQRWHGCAAWLKHFPKRLGSTRVVNARELLQEITLDLKRRPLPIL